jgi:arylsulfatase A-like enzyme
MDGTDFIERKDVNRNMPARDLEHILALYDGEIRFTDEHVGRVLARIDELGLRDNTLVIVVSDHGDEFFEHGNKGHHRTLYQEVLRVPLIVRLPDGRWAGESVSQQASLVDILPTIMDVAGLDGPPVMEGLSLLELRAATPRSRERAVYGEFFDKRGFNLQIARRLPTSKTIQHFNRITHPKKAPVEYYDLARDAEEQHDLAEERREELRVELDGLGHWSEQRWRAQQHTLRESQSDTRVELDSETLERLKSLGYVGE